MRHGIEDIERQIASGARFVPVIRELDCPATSPEVVFRRLSPLLSPLGDERRCFLFTSRSGESHATYIGVDPFETLIIRGGRAEIESAGERFVLPGSPVDAIASRLRRYRSHRVPGLPGFQGGAFGYISYDFVRFLEPRLQRSGYFRELSKGDRIDGELMFFNRVIVFDHTNGRTFVIAGILVGEEPPSREEIQRAYDSALEQIEVLRLVCEVSSRPHRHSPNALAVEEGAEVDFFGLEASLGAEKFKEGVSRLKAGIRDGDIFQAVLSDRFRFQLHANPHDVFAALNSLSPPPYSFHMQCANRRFLGASPEMLLRVTGDQMETHPIAGTRPTGRTEAEDRKLASQLRRSVKEGAEHLMLVDLARNDLGRVAVPGSVHVSSFRELRRFNSVMHLVSRVQAHLRNECSPFQAFAACFPAGTLSGAPKVRAMEMIAEIETEARGFYGGAVVAAAFTGDLDSCISIRSLEIEDGYATLQAGAGIVADSHPEREYQEIQHKTRALRRALAIAGQGGLLVHESSSKRGLRMGASS